MVIKLRTLVAAIPALAKLAEADLSLPLAYRLRRSFDVLQKEADFFAAQRQKILEKYGAPKEDGTYAFEEENERRAAAELETLLELEVSPETETLEIPVTEGLRLSVNDMGLLAPFVRFTERGE